MTWSEEGITKLERDLARAQEKKDQIIEVQSEWSEWASMKRIQRKIIRSTCGKQQMIR